MSQMTKDNSGNVGEELKGTKVGVVESDKRDKTRKVVFSYMDAHPKYGKFIRKRTVLHVHDEKNESRTGDVVEVRQCRPISKTKTWTLVRIVERRNEQALAIASAAVVGQLPSGDDAKGQ
jgi:small subunit ribosomal protein S17